MTTLFRVADVTCALPDIPGLYYKLGFITPQEESELVAAIDSAQWDTRWKRRRQPYGRSYDKTGETPRQIPGWAQFLVDRLQYQGISEKPFDQMLINEYLPGQGIGLHKDYEPFDRTVVSLSLLSACVMDFRPVRDGERESLLLEPRSLLVLSDEARYEWQHGIAARKRDHWDDKTIPRLRRLSVTFRLLKERGFSRARKSEKGALKFGLK
jgi:alkylated DNA repair dioxygenase AlkB